MVRYLEVVAAVELKRPINVAGLQSDLAVLHLIITNVLSIFPYVGCRIKHIACSDKIEGMSVHGAELFYLVADHMENNKDSQLAVFRDIYENLPHGGMKQQTEICIYTTHQNRPKGGSVSQRMNTYAPWLRGIPTSIDPGLKTKSKRIDQQSKCR